jgi:phosphate starvation-inducible PhoH-like protein
LENLNIQTATQTITLEPSDTRRLATLCGQFDENLRHIEQRLKIEIRNRGNTFALIGDHAAADVAGQLLHHLYQETGRSRELTPDHIHLAIQQSTAGMPMEHYATTTTADSNVTETENAITQTVIRTKKGNIKPRGLSQQRYVRAVQTHDINFGVGPAGTGNT